MLGRALSIAGPGCRRAVRHGLSAALLLAGSAHAQPPSALNEAIQQRTEKNEAAIESQQQIDALSDDIDALATEYRRALQDTKALQVYNKQLEEIIASQEKEMVSLEDQIQNVTVVGRQVVPLMLRMIDTLEAFVELDTPFLPEERRKRIADLRAMMDRADVTISEKYRRIIEAYQVENDYGRTIEAYRATIGAEGGDRTVDFLRVGRIALLYQTLDAEESGMWSGEEQHWTVLDGGYRSSIRQGLRIARKQVAPDLLKIPVAAPREVSR